MNYELAKKLKDAGFPQPDECVKITDGISGEYCRLPTISELIEACGEDFGALLKEDNEYLAYEYCSICFEPEDWGADILVGRSHSRNLNACGSTPEEAIANLWLELNKLSTGKKD